MKYERGIQVERYAGPPSDEELGRFLCPLERPMDTHIHEDDHQLRLRPAGLPMWPLLLGLLPVAGGIVYVVGFSDIDREFRIAMGTIPPLLMAGVFGFAIVHRRYEKSHPPSLIFDKKQRTLCLPRHDVVFKDFERLSIIEIYGWHRSNAARHTYTKEVTLLAREDDGTYSRYTLYVATTHRKVMRAITRLADAMRIPYRRVKRASGEK